MKPALPDTSLKCTQCGGELHPDEGQIFLTCPYCGAAVYLDKSQVVFHWYLASTLDEAQARAALAHWMAGNQTVKDLDKKATLDSVAFEYFPIWYLKRRWSDGREEILLEPAAATSISELRHLKLPPGDLRRYEASLDAQAHAPSVPLEAALGWAAERQPAPGENMERALVHLPLFTCKYRFAGQTYTAVVEGGSGGVFANIFPAKPEAPYRLAAGAAAAVFALLALIPVIGYFVDETQGAQVGFLLCGALGAVVAPGLFAAAAWVAAKV